uniref:Uncharacterized protein n=1 Tax=Amphimedon queenslandica TaxID=400682 RepID=A0A1X7SPN8_AMPQE
MATGWTLIKQRSCPVTDMTLYHRYIQSLPLQRKGLVYYHTLPHSSFNLTSGGTKYTKH